MCVCVCFISHPCGARVNASSHPEITLHYTSYYMLVCARIMQRVNTWVNRILTYAHRSGYTDQTHTHTHTQHVGTPLVAVVDLAAESVRHPLSIICVCVFGLCTHTQVQTEGWCVRVCTSKRRFVWCRFEKFNVVFLVALAFYCVNRRDEH